MFPTQNFLSDKRDHNGVINIVVSCVATRDIFQSKLGGKANNGGIVWLQNSVCSFIHRPEFADKGLYDDQCGVEHVNDLDADLCRCKIAEGRQPSLITRVGELLRCTKARDSTPLRQTLSFLRCRLP